MKRLTMLAFIILIIGCANGKEKDDARQQESMGKPNYYLSMTEYHNLKNNDKKIIELFERMDPKNRWKFFQDYLPGSIMRDGNLRNIYFLRNGKILIYTDKSILKEPLKFGKWHFAGNVLVIVGDEKSLGFNKARISDFHLRLEYINKGRLNESVFLGIYLKVDELRPNFLENTGEDELYYGDDGHIGYVDLSYYPQIREYCEKNKNECFGN